MTALGRRGVVALLVVGSVALLGACTEGDGGTSPDTGDGRTTVRVAAAADLKFALDEVVDLVAAEDPRIVVDPVYGSSGTFLQQIENGAPFDLYLSADLAYPRALVDSGKAAEEDLFAYAVGRLVLWVPEGSPLDPEDGLAALTDPAVRRVSIANPEHAPYGEAAVAALETSGVYDEVRPKLVLGENVAQAAEFVQSGNADAGVVAKSLVLSDPVRGTGRWYELPLDLYPRLHQGGVVLGDARDADAARTVRDVLLSEPGREILDRYGFTLPEGEQ
ncbi:MAG TPA: molybdate ABC transporter substrate-binding protein [Nocardioidaceae bacterium]